MGQFIVLTRKIHLEVYFYFYFYSLHTEKVCGYTEYDMPDQFSTAFSKSNNVTFWTQHFMTLNPKYYRRHILL